MLGIALMTGMHLFAQDTTVNKEKAEKTEKYTVQTNLFGDNWFAGVNAGAQLYMGDYFSQGKAGKLITPTFEVNVGKWFTPGIGLRVGFGGYQAKGYSLKDGDFAYKHVDRDLYRTKWGMLHLHTDAMLNLTNLICGYREDRVYNAIPYVGIGYLRGIQNKDNELSGTVGFINRFRLNSAWDLNLEARGTVNNDVLDGIRGGKNMEGSVALMVGATYRFKARGWNKGTGISAAEMQAVQSQLRQMHEENASLRDRVNTLEEEKRQSQPATPVMTPTTSCRMPWNIRLSSTSTRRT